MKIYSLRIEVRISSKEGLASSCKLPEAVNAACTRAVASRIHCVSEGIARRVTWEDDVIVKRFNRGVRYEYRNGIMTKEVAETGHISQVHT